MTRAALTLELLAVLALACERQDTAPLSTDAGVPVESADPEWTNTELEHELDRIEQEIKNGKQAAVPDASLPKKPPKRRVIDAGRRPIEPRNKSKKYRNSPEAKGAQSSGSGST